MAEDQTHQNLLAEAEPATRLPPDPAIAELADHGRQDFLSVVRDFPASSLCWALLAEGSLMAGTEGADVAAYAYARTGYHRGLDALRKAGWKGRGPIPWEHLANQGFLRSLWALSVAADRVGEQDEAQRCEQFLRESSETAWQALRTTLVPGDAERAEDAGESPESRTPGNTDGGTADADPREDGDTSPESPDDGRRPEEKQEAAQPQG